MTAQISDTLTINGREYQLAGVEYFPMFDPPSIGIQTATLGSACWRGYIAGYEVVNDRLVLRDLLLARDTTVNDQPLVPGEQVIGADIEEVEHWSGAKLRMRWSSFEFLLTGGLLVGADFVASGYLNMGFHPAWRFKDVLELRFDAGNLVETIDLSVEMAELRDGIESGEIDDPDGERGGPEWVDRTFTHGYERSFGAERKSSD